MGATWRPSPRRPRRKERGGRQEGILDGLIADLRFGLRLHVRRPGFAIVALLVLGLGLGATTTLYSVIHAALVQPLPYRDASRVLFLLGWDNEGDQMRFSLPLADFEDLRQRSTSFEAMAAYRSWSANLSGVGEPERVQAYRTTSNAFRLLGVEPALGRGFESDEVETSVLLSHAFWQRRFGGDGAVVGRSISLDGTPHTVIGVMPAGFDFPIFNYKGDVWSPLRLQRDAWQAPRGPSSVVIARLRPDLPLATGQAEVDRVMEQLAVEHPRTNAGLGARARPMQAVLSDQLRPALLAGFGAVVLVLMMICATVANLQLVRGVERERELGVRTALGASRWRLFRQLLLENLVLALLSGALGAGLAFGGTRLLRGLLPDFVGRVAPALLEMDVHAPVLLFALVLTFVTTLLFGIAPARSAVRFDAEGLLHGGRTTRRDGPLRKGLVAVQVAIALVLMVGTGLMLRTFGNLSRVDPGFEAEPVLTMSVSLPAGVYADAAARHRFFRQAVERVEALPGVVAAGWINTLPFSASDSSLRFRVEAAQDSAPDEIERAGYRSITDGYLSALGVPLIRGRRSVEPLGDEGRCEAMVNRSFEESFLEGRAVGRGLLLGSSEEPVRCEVTGVVGDVLHWELTTRPRPEIYLPLELDDLSTMTLAARTAAAPTAMSAPVRSALLALDPELAPYDVAPLAQLVGNSLLPRRAATSAMGIFAVVALGLAVLGLYGIVAYTLRLRTPQIGIRLALGASSWDVVRLLLAEALVPVVIGLAAGTLAALVTSRLLASLLFGVPGGDLRTFVPTIAGLLVAALVASWLPARRAARVDPTAVMRAE